MRVVGTLLKPWVTWPWSTESLAALLRAGTAWALTVARLPSAEGTSPATRRSVNLLGKARRRSLSLAMSLCRLPSLLWIGLATREAHNGRWPLERANGEAEVAAVVVPALIGVGTGVSLATVPAGGPTLSPPWEGCVGLFLLIWRTSTSARPIPPPWRDMVTAN